MKRSLINHSVSVLVFLTAITSILGENSEIIYAFRNYRGDRPQKMILVGEIRSKIKMATSLQVDSPYRGYDARADQITVKVQDRSGIKIGQTLYVIDKNSHHQKYRNGLVVGEITVKSLFHSPFYGWVLTGQGILLRVREGNFVARTLESENLEKAFAMKKKGDFHVSRGEFEKAVTSYMKAIESDRSLPEAHAALGSIYMEEAGASRYLPIKAIAEFQEAYRYRNNFRYDYDRFQFCNDYMDALNLAYSLRMMEDSREADTSRMLDRIQDLGQIALEINPDHPDIYFHLFRAHYYLMNAHSLRSSPDERKKYDSEAANSLKYLKRLTGGPISDPQIHRIAVLYYYRIYRDLKREGGGGMKSSISEIYSSPVYSLFRASRQIPSSSEEKIQVENMIQYHLEHYFRYLDYGKNKSDPAMEKIQKEFSA